MTRASPTVWDMPAATYHAAVLRRSVSRLRAHGQTAAGALLVVTLLSASLIGEARQRPPFLNVDEAQWITSGYVAWKLLRELAPSERWEAAFDERRLADWGNKNPPLGKYLIGLAVTKHVRADSEVHYHWNFGRFPASEVPPDKSPPDEMLIAARTAIALAGAVALVGSYLVALELLGTTLWACLAPLCLFLVPSFQFHATRVFTDVPELALLLLGTHGLLLHARTGRLPALVWALACGGLACAVKLSAATFCVGVLVYSGMQALQRRMSRRWLLAAIVVPPLCFVAVNPYLYDAPLGKSVGLVRDWTASKALQRQHVTMATEAVDDLAEGIGLMSLRGALAPTSAPFPTSWASEEMWQRTPLLAGLLVLVLASRLSGGRATLRLVRRLLEPLTVFLLGSLLEAALTRHVTWYGGLCLLGLWSLATGLAGPRASGVRAFVCLLLVTWLLTTLWLPFDWSRYYLPTLGLMSGVYASGAAEAGRRFAAEPRAVGRPAEPWLRLASALLVTTFVLTSGWALFSVLTPPLLAQ